ncbi:hypothetical protein T484DRAFT_1898207 [Baffinella frigidus]|nr:hypothetical protein T484DRAFT_1898207 [Cryptophyta sp. CCMP2293]
MAPMASKVAGFAVRGVHSSPPAPQDKFGWGKTEPTARSSFDLPAPGFGDSKESRFAKPLAGAVWAPYGVRTSGKGARHMLTHEARTAEIKEWMEGDRFKRTFRNYNAEDVARLRGSVEWPRPASSLTATKLHELIRNLREQVPEPRFETRNLKPKPETLNPGPEKRRKKTHTPKPQH